METRASVQFGELSISLEGSETFVSAQLERFSELIINHASELGAPSPDGSEDIPDAKEVNPGKQKKTRSTSGSGAGCNAKVTELFAEGYFKTPRLTGQIVDKLRENATPYPSNKISAALISMTKRRKLRRYQEGGEWIYIAL